MRLRWPSLAALAILGTGLPTLGCRFLDQLWDRTESCHETVIVISNDEQTRGDAFVIGPNEPIVEQMRLHSGESREITLCLEIGHSYRFRVFRDNELVAVAKCPASRREYDAIKPAVKWTPAGLLCSNW